jgi:hypothetical protein
VKHYVPVITRLDPHPRDGRMPLADRAFLASFIALQTGVPRTPNMPPKRAMAERVWSEPAGSLSWEAAQGAALSGFAPRSFGHGRLSFRLGS